MKERMDALEQQKAVLLAEEAQKKASFENLAYSQEAVYQFLAFYSDILDADAAHQKKGIQIFVPRVIVHHDHADIDLTPWDHHDHADSGHDHPSQGVKFNLIGRVL